MRIFRDDCDYRQFVYILGDVAEALAIECWNYCVMPNHYHVTLVPRKPNLSEAIRMVNGGYAQWWNKHHGRVGHVFQGRFKDQIVEGDQYLLALSRYVAMNPVRARLVKRPEDWAWSSYRALAGLSPCPSFLVTGPTLRLFGDGGETTLQKRFVNYMASSTGGEATIDRIRSNERILGSRRFKAWLRSAPNDASAGGHSEFPLVTATGAIDATHTEPERPSLELTPRPDHLPGLT